MEKNLKSISKQGKAIIEKYRKEYNKKWWWFWY